MLQFIPIVCNKCMYIFALNNLLLQEKTKLRTYVIGAGMQYGMGEGIFHVFFKVL